MKFCKLNSNASLSAGISLFLAMWSAAAHANLVTNGSFEGADGVGCIGATTSLPEWVVATGNIDLLGSPCVPEPAADGNVFLDLTGNFYPAYIYQDLATDAGQAYELTFYFGGNPDWQYFPYPNDIAIKSMNLLVNDVVVGNYRVDTTGQLRTDNPWSYKKYEFTATSTSTRIGFQSLNTGVFGPILDDVRVEVPEPATLGIFGAGLLGLLAARRKSRA